MIRPTIKDFGRSVIYRPSHGEPEEGVITSFSKTWIFVRYLGDKESKATRPEDLEWAHA